MSKRWKASLAGAALATSVATIAQAGNDDGVLIGNQAILTGGAVTSVVSDGASAWYNPAGLARSNRNQLDVTGSAYGLNIYRVKDLFRLPDGSTADASTTDWVLVPSLMSFARQVSSDVVAGIAIFIPRTHDYDLRTSLESGGAKFVATANSALYEYDYALSVAKRFGPNLRAGLTAAGLYVSRRDTIQVAYGSPDDPAAGFYNGSNLTTVGNYGLRLSAGLQWAASPNLELGVSLQSPMLTGWSDVAQTIIQSSLTADTATPHFSVDQQQGPIAVWDFTTPARLRVGVAYQLGKTQLLFDGDISTPIDAPPELPDGTFVDRNWAGNGRIGMIHELSPQVTTGAGVFTDLSGEKPTRMNFVGTAFGVSLSTAHVVNGKPQNLVFSTTLGGRYAYGWGKLPGQSLAVVDGELATATIGAPAHVHELAFNLGGGVNF